MKQVYDSANSVAKAVNNDGHVNGRFLRTCHEMNVKLVAAASYSETRFGSRQFVLRSVLKVLAPIKFMCISHEFETLADGKVDAARKIIDITPPSSDGSFRQNALVEELIDPIMEALHIAKQTSLCSVAWFL